MLKNPGGVALGALLIATAIALRLLSVADMDPTVVTALGDRSTEITKYAEEKLGREVWTRRALGHDGRFFFVQASDPWLTDPEANAAILDRPPYRSQRMLYPTLACLGGLLPAEATAWGLIVVNVVAMGVGTAYTALLIWLALLLRSVRTPTELGWATAGFAVLGLMMSEPVWHRYLDSTRALAPVVSAYVLMVLAQAKEGRAQRDEASEQGRSAIRELGPTSPVGS